MPTREHEEEEEEEEEQEKTFLISSMKGRKRSLLMPGAAQRIFSARSVSP